LRLIDFYRAQAQLVEINGEQDMNAVTAAVLKAIDGHRL
jgi:adenylate kinase family enzyme